MSENPTSPAGYAVAPISAFKHIAPLVNAVDAANAKLEDGYAFTLGLTFRGEVIGQMSADAPGELFEFKA